MSLATGETTRTTVLVGRIERERILSWAGLFSALIVSGVLNLWNLAQNSYGNTYYAVAVQSMLQSASNFFYGSYDAGGFITVDKPPVALWIQALSAKIFGFSGLAILVPQALMGVAAVGLLFFLVKRHFGTLAGFVAAMALAVAPIAVAVERSNNTDTALMFTLVLAAWAISVATEKAKLPLLLLGMALVGVAFNVKMLEAFIILPTFYFLYLVAAPTRWFKKIIHLALASVVLFGVALSWPLAVDLTPANIRPWVGGSGASNSVISLALNYNGVGRVTGAEGNTMGGGGTAGQRTDDGRGGAGATTQNSTGTTTQQGTAPGGAPGQTGATGTQFNGQAPGGFGGGNTQAGGMFGAGVAGPLRLFGSELSDQWSWLIPLALFGLVAAIAGLRRKLPLEPKAQSLILWAGWLATYGVVFSMAEGIFHVYYTVMLTPAAAALVGIGTGSLWKSYRNGSWQAWLLPAGLLATALWQVKILADYPTWAVWLIPITLLGSIIAAVPLIVTRLFTQRAWRTWAPALVGVGLVAVFVAPAAWSVTPVLAAGNGTMPEAGVSGTNSRGGFGGQTGAFNPGGNFGQAGGTTTVVGQPQGGADSNVSTSMTSYLEANQDGYFYLVAVSSANQASSIALSTGKAVLAMAGFSGSDPAMTVERLQTMIANKQIRFVMGGGQGGGQGGSTSVSSWIQTNCTLVDASTYGGTTYTTTTNNRGGFGGGNSTLYDCAAN